MLGRTIGAAPDAASGRRPALAGVLTVLAALAMLALPSPAEADLLESFTAEVRDESGGLFTQAGGHPFEAFAEIKFLQHDENGRPVPDESVRNIHVDLPPGLVGNPQAIPRCTRQQFFAESLTPCPEPTQVGVASLTANNATSRFPVYNMVPVAGRPAEFAFRALVQPIFLRVSVRPDGGLRVTIPNISQSLPLTGTSLSFWGVPADPAHDTERGQCARTFDPTDECPTQAIPRPFLTTPTSCTGPVTTVLRADSWQDSGNFEQLESTTPVGADGCDRLPFDADVKVQPSVTATDSPTGLSVEIEIPQTENPQGLVQSHLRRAEVTLPEGMSINPAAADGLAGCTPAQIGLGTDDPPQCPPASKLGTVEIDSPLQPKPLRGGIFQATPHDNPFNDLIAIYLVAEGPGTMIKLAGEITRDPQTGRVTTTMDGAPQLPFSSFRLKFFGGPRAALATGTTCGTKTAIARLTPWSGQPPVTLQSSYRLTTGPGGSPCAASATGRAFTPQLRAGLLNPIAGSSSPFTLRVSRPDGQQEIAAIDATLPEGISAVIRGVPRCPDAQAATGTCPAASQIGTVLTKVGAGASPFQVTGGRIYLGGPYEGAPLSLVVVVPAKAGIFDLGNVIVRSAVFVDPADAHLRVVSDPIPQILDGIPLRIRAIALDIDRPRFMTSPTSCERKQVGARIAGASGALATTSEHFQMAACAGLGFAPRLNTRIGGSRRATRRNAHPGLAVTLRTRDGDANVDRVAVTLPRRLLLDQDSLETICTRAQYAADECPEASMVGRARADTPLLDEPLAGPVYLRASDNPLPDLVVDLNGIVEIDLVGRIDQNRGRIRNTFETPPDVPFDRFRLQIDGGRDGLLVNSGNLCRRNGRGKARAIRARARLLGQNGARANQRPKLRVRCGKGKGRAKGRRGSR